MGGTLVTARAKNLLGMRFGRLVVIRRSGTRKAFALWECQCDCGNLCDIRSDSLKTTTRSCGCIAVETSTVHGDASGGKVSTEYRSWASAINRCSNPENNAWADYGGRGITVCERWRSSFPAFLEDMGRKPTPRHSIDRVDSDKGYEPGNCRWATKKEQANNRRPARRLAASSIHEEAVR